MNGIVIKASVTEPDGYGTRTIEIPEMTSLYSLHYVLVHVFAWKKINAYSFESADGDTFGNPDRRCFDWDKDEAADLYATGFFCDDPYLLYTYEGKPVRKVKLTFVKKEDFDKDHAVLLSFEEGSRKVNKDQINEKLSDLELDLIDPDDDPFEDDFDETLDEDPDSSGQILHHLISLIHGDNDMEGFVAAMLWLSRLYHAGYEVWTIKNRTVSLKGEKMVPLWILSDDVPPSSQNMAVRMELDEVVSYAIRKHLGICIGYESADRLILNKEQTHDLPQIAEYTDRMFDSLEAPLEEVFATPDGQRAKALVDEAVRKNDLDELDEIQQLMKEAGISEEDRMAVLYRCGYISLMSIGDHTGMFEDTFAAALQDRMEELQSPEEWKSLVIDSKAEQDELQPIIDQIQTAYDGDDEEKAYHLFQKKYWRFDQKLDEIIHGLEEGTISVDEVTRGKYSHILQLMHTAIDMLEGESEIFEITVIARKVCRIMVLIKDELESFRWRLLLVMSLDENQRSEEADHELEEWKKEELDTVRMDAVTIDLLQERNETDKAQKIAAKYLNQNLDTGDVFVWYLLNTMEELYQKANNRIALKTVRKMMR